MTNNSKRLYSLDALKTVAAYLVVFQHACGTGVISDYILALARVAVPLFMMITGYFYGDTVKHGNEKKQLIKFTKIAVAMCLFYFAVDICWNLLSNNILDYLKQYLNVTTWINFFVFNDPIPADLSWYMWAMIYVLLLMNAIPCIYKNVKIRRSLIAVCLIASLIFGKFSIVVLGREFSSIYTRNAWTIGIPYFLLGIEIKEYSARIENKIDIKKWALAVVTFILLNIAERRMLIYFNVNASRDSYVCTTLLAIAIFILFLSFSNMTKNNAVVKFGIKYSLMLYAVHSLFVKFEVRIFDINSYQQVYGVLFVFTVASLVAVSVVKIKDLLINKMFKSIKYS